MSKKTIWFSSDMHLDHANILKFCNRPFDNVWEMNKAIIENHNACVKPDDHFFHLGDFAWRNKEKTIEYLKQLNGKKFFIAGNHDGSLLTRDSDFNIETRPKVAPHIKWIKDYYELTIQDKSAAQNKQMIILSHYAMRAWNKSHWNSFMLHGHSHNMLPDDPSILSIDVGVDAVANRYAVNGVLNPKDYRPICYEEIKVIMEAKQSIPIDHHK